jgi:DNA invertase Pin-like site-specific DNA recombinase
MGFIAYYRVSTDKQGISGLGLDAQQAAVMRHIGTGKPLAEYTEVESGKRHSNRPQLLAALADCKKRKATLIIAKLDRLGRNVAFIAALMDSGVDFVCCDNPHANRLMLHMLAAFAEHEREQISQRTIAALAQAKKRGVILGNPRLAEARAKSIASHNASRPTGEVMALMREWRANGATYDGIAQKLNGLNIKPSRGDKWYAMSVRNQLERKPA